MDYSIAYLAAEQGSNSYDWLWGVGGLIVLIVPLIFWIASLISIIRSGYGGAIKFMLALATLAYPIIGPIIWFLFGRNTEYKTRMEP